MNPRYSNTFTVLPLLLTEISISISEVIDCEFLLVAGIKLVVVVFSQLIKAKQMLCMLKFFML